MIKRRTVLWIATVVAAAALAAFFAWALFVPAADWLARHDIGNATGISLETARNNARGNLLALTAGIAGLGALLFTARNFVLQRRTLQLTEESQRRAEESQRRTLELTEQGQVTDRFTKAIDQLGSDRREVRIGGIYALERIMNDSERDQSSIVEILAAYIRGHAPRASLATTGDVQGNVQPSIRPDKIRPPTDVAGTISVLGRRPKGRQERGIDLKETDLRGAYMVRADLHLAVLTDADLSGADMREINLYSASMAGANLSGACLREANLSGADLRVNLSGADLRSADLSNAALQGADLQGADLRKASLEAARGLERGQLEKAMTDFDTKLPAYLLTDRTGGPPAFPGS